LNNLISYVIMLLRYVQIIIKSQFCSILLFLTQVLHDIQTLERHPIIKIVNEFKKREEDEYNL
jgi:hypothetical protein